METPDAIQVDVHLDEQGAPTTMIEELRRGLTASPKRIPSKYFYDETGSRLFEQITHLPEYYLTRAEQALLAGHATELAAELRPQTLMELGSGNASKTRLLIDACRDAGRFARYIPVEVSEEMARSTAHRLAREYPGLEIHVVVADFERDLGKVPAVRDGLVALLGSTLGNFPAPQAIRLLTQIPHIIQDGGSLLLGVDLVKEPSTIEAAYNDSQGVTARFNRNILQVLNELVGANFRPERFAHLSRWNPEHERIETYLRSECEQTVRLPELDLTVRFDAGELLETEVSCKYTERTLQRILDASGMTMTHWLPAADGSFALAVARCSRSLTNDPG